MSFWIRHATPRVVKDSKVNTSKVSDSQVLPIYTTSTRPTGQYSKTGGAIAFDTTIKKVIYFDGINWIPLSAGGGGAVITGFSYYLANSRIIPSSTPTVLSGWTAPSLPFSAISSFNDLTGVYTAPAAVTLCVSVGVSWSPGFSNTGTRIVNLIYDDGSQTMVKASITQADPNVNVETVQELSTTLVLNPGDKVYVEVESTSNIGVEISDGSKTVFSGIEIQ